jgi:hypothetical protein
MDATCGPFLYRITPRVDGGLELPLKVVQARLGYASIQMTADRYGHLFHAVMTAPSWLPPSAPSCAADPGREFESNG